MLTLLLLRSGKGEDTAIFNECAYGFFDCRSVQLPVLWDCRIPEEVVFSLGLHVQADLAESEIIGC